MKNDELMTMEMKISRYLRKGVFLCFFILLMSFLINLFLSSEIISFFSLSGIFLLILLPFFRVAMTNVLFFKQKDFIFFGLSLFVLIIMVMSMILGVIKS